MGHIVRNTLALAVVLVFSCSAQAFDLGGLANQLRDTTSSQSNTAPSQDVQPTQQIDQAAVDKAAADQAAEIAAQQAAADKAAADKVAADKAAADQAAEIAAQQATADKVAADKAAEVAAQEAAKNGKALIFGAIFTVVSTILLLVFFSNSVRKSVPTRNGNFAVRNFSSAWGIALGVPLFLGLASASISGLPNLFGFLGFVVATALAVMFAKVFAVTEAGVAYDAEKKSIEVSASGIEADSFMDYFKPSYLFSCLRRDHIPVDTIRSLTGGATTTTTRTYNKASEKFDTRINTVHRLNIISTLGQWTIKFGSEQKAHAARTLISEVASLS